MQQIAVKPVVGLRYKLLRCNALDLVTKVGGEVIFETGKLHFSLEQHLFLLINAIFQSIYLILALKVIQSLHINFS